MKSIRLLALAAASVALSFNPVLACAGDYAARIVDYQPGEGVPPRFTHPDAALGAPSSVNPFGEATDPFNPPYGTNQIVSIGTGGSLVVKFHTPILNHPHNPHGLDFIIFGNAGFIITNDFDPVTFQWIGTPATDGTVFGTNPGETRVSVSRDGVTFYVLNPAWAPTVDGVFPPDAEGAAGVPTLPGLAPDDFAGATLQDIRTLYHGSAGGAGFDISWAVDAEGHRVHLPTIHFVRIDVLSGRSEVDAIAVTERKGGPAGPRGK